MDVNLLSPNYGHKEYKVCLIEINFGHLLPISKLLEECGVESEEPDGFRIKLEGKSTTSAQGIDWNATITFDPGITKTKSLFLKRLPFILMFLALGYHDFLAYDADDERFLNGALD